MKAINILNRLVQLDLAAMENYELASERVDTDGYRTQLRAFRADHERHVHKLGKVMRRLGGASPSEEERVGVLPGMVGIGDKKGDHPVLIALENNAHCACEAYRDALEHLPAQAQAREVLARIYDDEARHLNWLNVSVSDLQASASYQGVSLRQRPPAASPPLGS